MSAIKAVFPVVLLGSLLSACSSNWDYPGVYKTDIKQGNIITEENVELLQLGLTRKQVRYVMGTPLLVDIFDDSHWNYIYILKAGDGTVTEDRVRVVFNNDRVSEIIRDF